MIRAVASLAASAAMGASGATFVAMSADAPMTQFVTCDVTDHGHAVFGGREIRGTDEYGRPYVVELVGPIAATNEGARLASVRLEAAYGPAIDDRCEVTPIEDVWMVGLPMCDPARAIAGRTLYGC